MAPRWDKRLRLPKSEGGATICEKHEFIEAHFRDPEMSWEVDQAVTQAKDDGKRMEARLQELGEEANNLEDALSETEADRDRLRSELDRLRSAPVAVEVPETEIAALAEEFGVWPDDVRKIASKLQPIPTPRILNDGEIHGTPEALAEICEDAGWLWMHSPIGDKKTLLEFMTDALRSKEGEA